jgi:site-specific recombinase XerD
MSVRTFFHFLVEAEVISGSPLLSTRSPSQPQGHLFCVQPAHFRKLCRHLDSLAKLGDRKALRDLALVLVLGHAGLKASEAAALRWEDVHLPPPKPKSSGGRLIVRNAEKVRMVPLDVQTHRTLLAHRQAVCQEHNPQLVNDSEPLGSLSVFFGYQNMTRRPSLKAMQRHSVKFILYELCRDILDIPYNSESFRNHAILGWLGKGYDSERVADLAGYASLQSLERFLTSSSTLDANRRRRETRPRTRTDERTGHAETDRSLRDP